MVDYLEELKSRVPVFSVLSSGNALILCPFHEESNPSCAVSVSHGSFRCFSGACAETGSFAKLVAQLDGVSIEEAKATLPIEDSTSQDLKAIDAILKEDIETKKSFLVISRDSFHRRFVSSLHNQAAVNYLSNRGVTKKMILKFDLRWGGTVGIWKQRIIIPVYDERKRIVAFAGRHIAGGIPKVRLCQSPRNTLYGLYRLWASGNKKLSYLIIVEGSFDAMHLQRYGYNAVAVMGTSHLTVKQCSLLVRCCQRVILCYDGDAAGRNATARSYGVLHQIIPTERVILEDGIDPDNLTCAVAHELLGELIK